MRYYVYLIGFIASVVLAVIGGIAFRFLEFDYEQQIAEDAHVQINEFLRSKSCMEISDLAYLEKVIYEAQSGGIRIRSSTSSASQPALENITNWDLQSTIFLALQVIGSVGYGNAPPMTTGGRVFCVFYGLLGLPLFVVAAFGIGDFLLEVINKLRVRMYTCLLRRKAPPGRTNSATAVSLVILSVVGILLFVVLPSAIFMALENWTYAEALYCCFITVLTVGFADFVPGEDSPASYRTWYRLGVGVWIMLALLWFGGIFTAIRKLLKYDEIHKPFQLKGETEEQRNLRMRRNWKKRFERQWNKLRGRRRHHHQHFHNPPRPSAEAMDARQRISQLEVLPTFTDTRRHVDAPVYDATGNHVTSGAAATTLGGNMRGNISRVEVKS